VSDGVPHAEAQDRAAVELGDEDELFRQIVTRHPPPFVCRHPALSFTLGPISALALSVGVFIGVGACLFLTATRVFGVPQTEPTFRWLVLSTFDAFALALTPVLAILFCRTASRHGLSLKFVVAACAILMVAGGFVLTDLVLCPASGSLKYFQRIGLNTPRIALVAAVFAAYAVRRYLRRRRGVATD